MRIARLSSPQTPQPCRPARLRTLWRARLLGLLCLLPMLGAMAWAAPDATMLLDAGRADDALRLFASQSIHNDAAAQNYLGRVYYSLRDWDHALKHCQRAAQLEPNNAIYQLWLGRSYGQKANVSNPVRAFMLARKTVAAFQKAHSLAPDNMAIARDLAEYYIDAPAIVGGGTDKAEALASEVAASHPADAAWIRAGAANHQGEKKEAERQFREAIRLDHDSATPYLALARFYRSSKRWDAFDQEVYKAVHATHVRGFERYEAAEMLLHTDRDLDEAEQQMQTYLNGKHFDERAPVFRAHYLLGQILLKKGEPAQARAQYRAALQLAATYRPAKEALRRLEKN